MLDHHGGKHDSRQVVMVLKQYLRAYILIYRQEAERKRLGQVWAFETSKPISSDTLLTRSHFQLLILPKGSIKLNQTSTWGHSHINHNIQTKGLCAVWWRPWWIQDVLGETLYYGPSEQGPEGRNSGRMVRASQAEGIV